MIIFASEGALLYKKDMPMVKQIKCQKETLRPS